MQRVRIIPLVAVMIALSATTKAAAQKPAKGVGGKTACGLLTPAEIQGVTGRKDVARSPGKPEEAPFTSNCMYMGAIDITIHLGQQTKVMFGRERDTYAKAPARLGYKIEPSGIGDDAYFMSYSGKAEVRVIVGEGELVVSLSGSLPPEADAKKIALNLTKAAVAKLTGQ
jgi:hypothetical protein